MRKSLLVFFACLCAAACGQAQENTGKEVDLAARLLPQNPVAARRAARSAQFFETSAARSAFAVPSTFSLLAPGDAAHAGTALAGPLAPKPLPRQGFAYNRNDDRSWQLSLGFSYMSINGPSPLNGNFMGFNTSLSYFINEWFAIEGVATSVASFTTVLTNDYIAVGVYGGGIRMVYREQRWQPWVHFAMGLAHERTTIQLGGKNALGYVVGGGADYRFSQLLSWRIQADLVGTGFFGQTQRNYQVTTGLVLNF